MPSHYHSDWLCHNCSSHFRSMNFVLIFAGLLCAFVIAGPHDRVILSIARNIAQKFTARTQLGLTNIENLSRSVTIENQNEIVRIIASAKTQINAALAKIESTLNDLLIKGGAIALCARSIFTDLNSVRNTFTRQAEACSANLIDPYEIFNVPTNIDLETSIFQLPETISGSSPSATESQISNENDLNASENTFVQSTEPVKIAANFAEFGSFQSIVDEIRSCAQQAVAAASVEINKLSVNVQLCSF